MCSDGPGGRETFCRGHRLFGAHFRAVHDGMCRPFVGRNYVRRRGTGADEMRVSTSVSHDKRVMVGQKEEMLNAVREESQREIERALRGGAT